MTEPINDINQNNKSCCSYIDDIEDLWNNNKYKISSRLSIVLGVLSSAGSALVGLQLFVPASIVLGGVSLGVFFAGVALSKYENTNKILEKDNETLKAELTRKMTLINNFQFPTQETPTGTDYNISPTSVASTKYNEVVTIEFNK